MKTSVSISDDLAEDVKELARRRKTTIRALIDQGLRRIVEEAKEERTQPFRLRQASVKGAGLQSEFRDAPWEEIRRAAYGERGG